MNGKLFTTDFLVEGIKETDAWKETPDKSVDSLVAAAREVFAAVPPGNRENEGVTEEHIIKPILRLLGWTDLLPVQNLSPKGREEVPDLLLFSDEEHRQTALREKEEFRRYRHGLAIAESKRWELPLDRPDQGLADKRTPSSKMLWYIKRAAVMSDGAIRWGILTNGRLWRLYWSDARSIAEDFLELDLPAILGVPGLQLDLFDPINKEKPHVQKVFLLLFGKDAFRKRPIAAERLSFHQIALQQGREWERRISDDLGGIIFDDVFPALGRALVDHDSAKPGQIDSAYLDEITQAALVFLYRLLFVFYAEDRRLLPVYDPSYQGYSVHGMREEIASLVDGSAAFSASATGFHDRLASLYRAIATGDAAIGLPPYNGGLFDPTAHPVLDRIRLPDAVLAPLIDSLSREQPRDLFLRWINYRDLSVQHLGSIYERILEYRLTLQTDGTPSVQLSRFARKGSGSYYTHDDLVQLIIRETIQPLIDERIAAFERQLQEHTSAKSPQADMLAQLALHDPAEAILSLTVCDPAMGSGHFLVVLVDYVADRVLEQMAAAPVLVAEALPGLHYDSPVAERIGSIRQIILAHAEVERWNVPREQLDDRHLVRRIILKRLVFGVDKNPMAVELAKVALWLHTFTVGAPLSFLDHHLKCGDSLFGEWITTTLNQLDLLLQSAFSSVKVAAQDMNELSDLSDADLEQAHQSQRLYQDIEAGISGIRRVMNTLVAGTWLAHADLPDEQRQLLKSIQPALLDAAHAGPVDSAAVNAAVVTAIGGRKQAPIVQRLIQDVLRLADELRPLHWELAFPTVWRPSISETIVGPGQGGFDAVIGNPPWERMKLQEVEWFADRDPEIANRPRAADRKKKIAALAKRQAPLWRDYDDARRQAETAAQYVRRSGHYLQLSGGDVNLYSLFVERAQRIVKPGGIVGLLVPSGIASDKGASKFFKGITTAGRLAVLFDFENKKQFFPDIDSRFKFCALVFGGAGRSFPQARGAFFLHNVAELQDPERTFALGPADFLAVNPNTGTAPVFRNRRDAQITVALYRKHPVFHDRARQKPEPLWPVQYHTMFHMTNDSALFKTAEELDKEGFYPVQGNLWKKGKTVYVPLYEGKMVQAYDHRAASVVIHAENLHRPNQAEDATPAQHQDPAWLPTPLYWVDRTHSEQPGRLTWVLCFKDVTAPTNMRTMIAAIAPGYGFGNTLPVLLDYGGAPAEKRYKEAAPLLLANLNSMAFDYVLRQKVQGQHINLYILEQTPLIAPQRFSEKLGTATVADFVREQVLRLSYTTTDLKPFAKDMGYTGKPFAWDEEDRRHRRARLDALFFHLYGIAREDAAYILDTFPIIKRHDMAAFGRFRTKDLVLGYMNAVAAGDTDSVIDG